MRQLNLCSHFTKSRTSAQMRAEITLAQEQISMSVSSISNRVTNAEATLVIQAQEISQKVSAGGVISAINQSAEEIKISANKITLAGVTIADSFTATDLHITGESTFDGTLVGATGEFTGTITADAGYIGGTGGFTIEAGQIYNGTNIVTNVEDVTSNGVRIKANSPSLTLNKYRESGGIYTRKMSYLDADGLKVEYTKDDGTGEDPEAVIRRANITDGSISVHGAKSYAYVQDDNISVNGCGDLDARVSIYARSTGDAWIDVGNTTYRTQIDCGYIDFTKFTTSGDISSNVTIALASSNVLELIADGGVYTPYFFNGDVTSANGGHSTPIRTVNGTGYDVDYINTKATNASGSYYITVNGLWEAGTYASHNIVSASSDRRLKENFADTEETNALDVINRIKMRSFDWKETGAHQRIGFVADELEEIDTHFAFGGGYEEDGSINVKSVDTFYLLGYVVQAEQELTDIVTSLDERMTAEECRSSALEEQLASAFAEIARLEAKLKQASV